MGFDRVVESTQMSAVACLEAPANSFRHAGYQHYMKIHITLYGGPMLLL